MLASSHEALYSGYTMTRNDTVATEPTEPSAARWPPELRAEAGIEAWREPVRYPWVEVRIPDGACAAAVDGSAPTAIPAVAFGRGEWVREGTWVMWRPR